MASETGSASPVHTRERAQVLLFFFPASGFHFLSTPDKKEKRIKNGSVQEAFLGFDTWRKGLRVQAEHHDVLPQVPGPHHSHDALLPGLDVKNALELCQHKHLVISD